MKLPVRVAILREPCRAWELEQRLTERGYEVQVQPVTRIEYVEHPNGEDWAAVIHESQGVVFSSLNGVEALAYGVGGLERLATLLGKRVVAGLGHKCCAKLASVGVDVLFVATKSLSAGLARRLARRLPPASKVLYPGAEEVFLRVEAELQKYGHSVHHLVCYRTVRIPLEERGPIDWSSLDLAVVAAPSAVAAVVEDPALPRQFPFVAIGPTTASALRGRGLKVASLAQTPDAAGVFSAIHKSRAGKKRGGGMEGA